MNYLNRELFYILVLPLLIWANLNAKVYAGLDIEITQGVDASVPVAVYPFNLSANNLRANISQNDVSVINKVIAADLYRCGLFKPLEQSLINYQALNKLPVAFLQRQEVDYAIRGLVEQTSTDRYQVSFELIDLFQLASSASKTNNDPDQLNVSSKPVILTQSFTTSSNSFRTLGHHISDLIYERLTGIKGVFSAKVAYVNVKTLRNDKREYILEVADSDGYNPQSLLVSSEPVMSPTWSPSGKQIAYVTFEGHRSKIKVIELATGNTKTLSSFKGINGAPAWSPDGNKIALVLSKENVPKIYLLNLADNKLSQITYGTSIDTEPRWSPDGRALIFTSNRSGGPQIYKYELANSKINRLTYDGNYNARASFTPDGKKLVMLHRSQDNYFKIAVQDLATSNVDIISTSTMDESPSVSANGQQIIYATKDPKNGLKGILSEVSIDGRVKLKRAAREGDVQEPSWSPYL